MHELQYRSFFCYWTVRYFYCVIVTAVTGISECVLNIDVPVK